MKVLRTRISDMMRQEEEAKYAGERKSKVGTGDRSERIRTYNFPQSRVTDHRIGLTVHKLDQIMNGDIEDIIAALSIAEQAEMMDKGE
ncbi:Peptide chain release factor 1 [compost metagenome]